MEPKSPMKLLLIILGLVNLALAQSPSFGAVSNTTFLVIQNATAHTTTRVSLPHVPLTVIITSIPPRLTINSTTIIYQYPNATATSRGNGAAGGAAASVTTITQSIIAPAATTTPVKPSAVPTLQSRATTLEVAMRPIIMAVLAILVGVVALVLT